MPLTYHLAAKGNNNSKASMIEIIEKALMLINTFDKPSQKEPSFFVYKEHTFMTEGTKTYGLCYDKETSRMVFVKCKIMEKSIKFIDKDRRIPVERLRTYVDHKNKNDNIGNKYFLLK